MYGTVARLTVSPGREAELVHHMEQYEALGIDGHEWSVLYRLDADPSQFIMATVFRSREAYVANAESAEQHKRYLALRSLLAADPEWLDGTVLHADR